MSRAFVKEGESEQLREIGPTVSALEQYLRRENSGVIIRELKTRHSDKFNREVHDMSDGLSYGLNDQGRWQIYLD